jgi:bacteriorhodopsin
MKEPSPEVQLKMARRAYRSRWGTVVLAIGGAYLALSSVNDPEHSYNSYMFYSGVIIMAMSITLFFASSYFRKVAEKLEGDLTQSNRKSSP